MQKARELVLRVSDLLEQEFSALSLWCKACDGPHFDLNASVELLVPHVPDSLDRCGYCFVLKIIMKTVFLDYFTVHKLGIVPIT